MRIPELSASDVAARLARDADDTLLLDVREPEELAIASVEGAIHVPMSAVPFSLERVAREKEVFVLCHHGVRSRMICAFLRKQGYPRVVNVRGGIHAWAREVDPAIPLY